MPASSTALTSLALIGAAAAAAAATGQLLAPPDSILLPASESASEPLKWLGANSPYFAGPNVHNISSDVPEHCSVDQAASISRHGSRYPDAGAYAGWTSMQARFAAANYTATGALAFLPGWRTALTAPAAQIAMESPTGAKEAHDLGYQLRTRYPDLYREGDAFVVWANNYTRVLQTAKFFVQGYLGWNAAAVGSVVAVTAAATGADLGNMGNSLSPSDQCPAFLDTSGGDYATEWAAVYIPPIQARLQALLAGNLTLSASDIAQMPYLCGFESQLTGRLSPWCGVLTDAELQQYAYAQDLRYWYGLGPGTALAQTMMLPYLHALVGLLQAGPPNASSAAAAAAAGAGFVPPRLLATFVNDGQLTELVTASGVFDGEAALSGAELKADRRFVASRFVSMRGTIAFERLNCVVVGPRRSAAANSTSSSSRGSSSSSSSSNATYVRIRLNDAVYPLPSCQDGPGRSCLLSDYAAYVAAKDAAAGRWTERCNVTAAGAPTTVRGASFYTDLSSPWLQVLPPY